MQHSRRFLLIPLLMLAAVSQARAEAPASAKALVPFVNEQTVGVLRVNPDAVDLPAVQKWVEEFIAKVEPDPKAQAKALQPVRIGFTMAMGWLAEYKKAGGRDAYVALTADIEQPPALIIPLAPGADSATIMRLFTQFIPPGEEANAPFAAEVLNNSVVVGMKPVLAQLKTLKAAPRPDIDKALATTDTTTALQGIFLVSAELRQIFDAAVGQVPAELGGGPANKLSAAVQYAALSLSLPPAISAKLTIQATDAPAAKTLSDAAAKALEQLKPLMPAETIAIITPKVDGDRLTITLAQADAAKLIEAALLPALNQSRERAKRIQSMSNIRQLLQGGFMYANDHRDAWPTDIAELAKATGSQQALVNPLQPQRAAGYVYIKPTGQANANAIVIYEAYDAWGQGINVGFGDGHVEWMSDEAAFKKQLEASQPKK